MVVRERLRGTVLRDNPKVAVGAGAQTAHRERRVDVPRDLGGRRDRYAALEDCLLAVNDRHVGQRQLEDEPTHHLDIFVGDLLGCGLLHDGVLAHDMSLNVRPSDECRRRLSGRRNGELLDMGQRTGCCRFYLLNAVYSRLERQARRPAEPLLESGILKFLSSKRNALCAALSL